MKRKSDLEFGIQPDQNDLEQLTDHSSEMHSVLLLSMTSQVKMTSYYYAQANVCLKIEAHFKK